MEKESIRGLWDEKVDYITADSFVGGIIDSSSLAWTLTRVIKNQQNKPHFGIIYRSVTLLP